jgi:hypothetical protein
MRGPPDSKGEVIERGPQLGKALDHSSWEEEVWEYVHFLGAHAASLETRAAIVVPAQIAGLIALWTQLFTFEEALPHTLAWVAWGLLAVGVIVSGWLVTPSRLRDDSVITSGFPGLAEAVSREAAIHEICGLLQNRVRRLHAGLQFSIGISVLAFVLVILAYAVDKAAYGG